MSIYLTHTSLRTAWALVQQKGLADQTLCDVRRPLDAARTLREIKQAGYFDSGFLSHIPEPIDLLFPDKKSKIYSIRVNPHFCLRDLPEGSFRRLREGVYVLTPEINFVQMGEILSVPRLAAYGMELCGSYCLAPGTERGFLDRPPLTTINELLDAAAVGPRIRGVGKARVALAWVAPGSRSPRETTAVLFLCLPPGFGGYGFPLPLLNHPITLSFKAAQIAGVNVLHPDFCWPEARLLGEYDSDGSHLDEGRVIRDVNRKDAFAADGWQVVTITNERLWKAEMFDRIARDDIAPVLGVLPPELDKTFLEHRRELREGLFGFDPYQPMITTGRGRIVSV